MTEKQKKKLEQAKVNYCSSLISPCKPYEIDFIEMLRFQSGYEYGLKDGASETTEELQKEINEWKTKFTNLQKYLETQNCYTECAETWKKNQELQEQNDQAKEIIKEYYDLVETILLHYKINTEKSINLEVKAKAFLKEDNG